MSKQHKYSFAMSEDLFESLQATAEKQGSTIVRLIRFFIRLGLTLMKYEEQGADVIIRRPEGQEVQLLLELEY